MLDEKFLGLSSREQIFSVFIGGFLLGGNLASSFAYGLEKSLCQRIAVAPGSSSTEMKCAPHVKALEVSGGSAIILTASFGLAAAIAGAKKLKRKA